MLATAKTFVYVTVQAFGDVLSRVAFASAFINS